MRIDDETLMAWVDGELDAARAEEVARAVANDPALAAEAERLRSVRADVAEGFAGVADEPIPERLVAAAKAPAPSSPSSPAPRRARSSRTAARAFSRPAPAWAALAAGVAGLMIGVGVMQLGGAPDGLGRLDGGYLADASLARGLDRTPSGQTARSGGLAVTPLYSFVAADGRTCRAFHAARGESGVEGAACRAGADWRLLAVAPSDRPAPGSGEPVFRQAGGDEPAAVAAAIDDVWADQTLDAATEREAIARGWPERSAGD